MYLKRYTIASLVLMALVGWYVYTYVSHESLSLSFFGINLPSASIPLLVVLPMFILYVASVLHMAFYTLLGSFKLKKYDRDYEKLVDAFCDAFLLKENREHEFKTQRYKLVGRIVDNSSISPYAEKLLDIENEKLQTVIETIYKIQDGKSVDLKKFALSPTNLLVVLNNKNRYENGELGAEEILINAKNYPHDFLKKVYVDFVKTASGEKIMQYSKEIITKEALDAIIKRIESGEELSLSAEDFVTLLNTVELSKEEFIDISKALARSVMPEERLKIFEKLSEMNENAMSAYLYTAFDLEMIELADEILESSSPDEFKNFRAYKALKECNKNFNIDIFV